MKSPYRPRSGLMVPGLIFFLILTSILSGVSLFVKELSPILTHSPKTSGVSTSSYLRIFVPRAKSDAPALDEATALLDSAPLFMPPKSYSLTQISYINETVQSEVQHVFPDYPAEIQLDGAQFAVAARMSIPVAEAVDLGLGKLRESAIEYKSLGRNQNLDEQTVLEKRACEIKIVQIETSKVWVKSIPEFTDTDTLSPLWEPMLLYAAIGDIGIEAPPSPANTTGIEPLDKILLGIVLKTMEEMHLPKGNYRIQIYP